MSANHQHLRAFHVIAAEGSISRAARRLNVTQPTLSQQLKALEERHRVALFEGRKPPLRLTVTGARLFALTQRLFAAAHDIDDMLGESKASELDRVRLGSDSPIYGARMVIALKAAWPDCAIQLRIGNARETLGWLADATVDAAVVSDPPGDNNLFYEPLFADRLMVAMPVGHAQCAGSAFPLAAFTKERVLSREPTSRTRAAFERLMANANITPADNLELQNREAIREGVAAGLGIGVFVSSECPPDPRLHYLPIEGAEQVAHMTGHVVCPVERRRTTLGRAVLAAAATLREFSPLPLSSSTTGPGKTHPAIRMVAPNVQSAVTAAA